MQLVAYGAQDVYLTGSAQITFFKVIYRRHTNFSVEPIPQTFTGAADFGRTVTCTINRNGDLITNMYVNINLKAVEASDAEWGYVRRLGLAIVQHYKIEIGGSKIDEQYGDWLNIWYELSHKVGQERGFAKMIGDVSELTTISTAAKTSYQLYVPLQLWFNRNNGLALPLIALQYHDVRITIDFRKAIDCYNSVVSSTTPSIAMNDAQLVIDYVYLDSEERKRFAQASHEYLIEQLQFTGSETVASVNCKFRLNFNHPCKYLVWGPHLEKYVSKSFSYVAYSSNDDWESAREKFAKTMWLISREGFESVTAGDTTTFSLNNEAGANSGEVNSIFGLSNNWSSEIDNLVEAQIITSGDVSTSIEISSLDNIVLLKNNFTMEHLSYNIEEDLIPAFRLNSSVSSFSDAAVAWLDKYGIHAIDHFNYGNFIDKTGNPIIAAKLQLNGSDRFQERDGHYFNYVQPWQHFSNTPADGINAYSFALKPEDHQPSGTCNFSRIDNATLNMRLGKNNQEADQNYLGDFVGGNNSGSIINIYAVNYNVLRVMSGMAGAAYSN